MEFFGSVAEAILALVFAVAGVSKWRNPGFTATSFDGLGLPAPAFLARAVPLAEFAVAALLVIVPVVGAYLTLALLAFFTTLLATRLAQGVRSPCACFGSTNPKPLSWLSVARNVGLAALAAFALVADLG